MQLLNNGTLVQVSGCLKNSDWIGGVNNGVAFYLDKNNTYHFIKAVQSCGALIQNFMLIALAEGLATCWIGEVLDYKEKVTEIIGGNIENLELMAIVVLGIPIMKYDIGRRESLDSFII